MVDVAIEEGIETARMYLDSGPRVVNFHHSDLDPYEAKQGRARPYPTDTIRSPMSSV